MTKQSLICTAVGICGVLFILLLTPRMAFNPYGMFLPTTQSTYTPTKPEDVNMLDSLPSDQYKVIGEIRAEMAFDHPKPRETLMAYVKKLAADAGANAIVVQMFVPDTGVQQAYTFIGAAVRKNK